MQLKSIKSSNKIDKINLVTSKSPNSKISEEYRTIRTNLLGSMDGRKTQSLIVTSPNYNDGKSTTAANLAISITQLGKKVLLIDADLRNPMLFSAFKVNNSVGLSNVLTGDTRLEDAIKQTEIKGLDLLTSGSLAVNAADLLSSKLMKSVIETATNQYDMVLIDTPPVLEVADVKIFSDYCDGVILVVRYRKTENNDLIQAKKLLANSSNLVGIILNNKR
ncbi:CpsD/CapB family tyrosine-protein kinase [Gottfriedia acidiceleris]|uniref:CpsD/CapB family tyrosine-protein kinase n=1 Tax=Bacillaceae TaxID=186817 RepID=UPI000BECCB95|nr:MULTISPECIES: CpsD/CapB family tyrosine-protein kinase [unclassified Bacillus (in: firmicutes)]PEC50507.1 tyrosine protein kinase [Bacillus sp. AFS096315]PFM81960.1 tyrosine protein kinase [Bacillus sp. AFS077874]